MPSWVRAIALEDLPPGSGAEVRIGDRSIALFNVDGTVHAIDNACIHRGAPLGRGHLEGHVVTCPWHGWQFDVTTGAMVMNASSRVPCHAARIEGDAVMVAVE